MTLQDYGASLAFPPAPRALQETSSKFEAMFRSIIIIISIISIIINNAIININIKFTNIRNTMIVKTIFVIIE